MLSPIAIWRVVLTLLLVLTSSCAQADIPDISSAINKAGRQRMLSQRMAKAYFQIGLGVEVERSRKILDQSVALFERQLVELKTFAPSPEIRDTYQKLEKVWHAYRHALIGAAPTQAEGLRVLALSDEVLGLAHQGTQQLESRSATSAGRLVNIAGRQRMLSQRIAKFYQAASWNIGVDRAGAEIDKARREFSAALDELVAATSNTQTLREDLELVKQQWLFFEHALGRRGESGKRQETTIATTSERILELMENVVAQYERLAR